MRAALLTGGETLAIQCDDPRFADLIEEGADGDLVELDDSGTVSVHVERSRAPFPTTGWRPLARGAWQRNGEVVVRDVCTSGFDLHARVRAGVPELCFRWRPTSHTRAAALVLPARARLLARCVLLQYPALWWSGTRERVPLHASVVLTESLVAVVGGASGVGKSTLLAAEVETGASAVSDNLCVTDGRSVWGVVEPLRLEGAQGRRMPHGRRESRLHARVPVATPNVVALLRRSDGGRSCVTRSTSRDAGRALAGGTYTAGELRRYWPYAALLAIGTGEGPVHPPVCALSRVLADQVDTFDLALAREPVQQRLADLLRRSEAQEEAFAWT